MAKKGPAYYNCNERQSSCTRPKAKPRLGCPDCEYTIQRKIFIAELEQELRRLPRGTWKGKQKWPVSYLLKVLDDVAYQANTTKGVGRNWTVVTTLLVGIYRDERGKIEAVERANLQASAASPASNDEDEGDFD